MDWRKNGRNARRGCDCGGCAGALAGIPNIPGTEEKCAAGRPDERAAPGFANDWDGAGAEHRAGGQHWSERVSATGERDQGVAGWSIQLRADRHAGTNGYRRRTEEHPGTDRAYSKTTGGVSGVRAWDILGDKVARGDSGGGEGSRTAWRGDAGAFAGGFSAFFAICHAVPLFERRGGGCGHLFARQETCRCRLEISARRFSKNRRGRRGGEAGVCYGGEGARGFHRQEIYSPGRGDAGPCADVRAVGKRLLRAVDDRGQ